MKDERDRYHMHCVIGGWKCVKCAYPHKLFVDNCPGCHFSPRELGLNARCTRQYNAIVPDPSPKARTKAQFEKDQIKKLREASLQKLKSVLEKKEWDTREIGMTDVEVSVSEIYSSSSTSSHSSSSGSGLASSTQAASVSRWMTA